MLGRRLGGRAVGPRSSDHPPASALATPSTAAALLWVTKSSAATARLNDMLPGPAEPLDEVTKEVGCEQTAGRGAARPWL